MAMNDPADPSRPPARSALDWTAEAGRADRLVHELRRRESRRTGRRRTVAAVAGLALLAAALGLPRLREAGPAVAAPVVLGPDRQLLADGTGVDLRPGARIAADFSPALRRVTLLEGEAHFAVTPDPTRPFVVRAGAIEVRAVGTAFAVQLDPQGIAVLVTEGRVALDTAVSAAAPLGRTLATVAAGNQARVAAAPADAAVPVPVVAAVAPAEIAAQLAWRVPRLEFSATPLVEAVALFNRHSTSRLVLDDAALGQLRISGIVRADHPETLVQLLEANYPVVARTEGTTLRLALRGR